MARPADPRDAAAIRRIAARSRRSLRTRIYRTTARAVVLFLVAAVLPAIGFVVAGPTQDADARIATGGSGRYLGQIDWIEWGTANQAIPAAGKTVSSTRTVGGSTIVTTCTISNIVGAASAYRPGQYRNDGLDNLYNIGGTDSSNQLISGIVNAVNGATISFRVACSATLDGSTVPLRGLVIADAETSGSGEYIQARPLQTATWRIIDRFRVAGCTTSTMAIKSTDNTLRFTNPGIECEGGGPMAVGFMDGATSADMSVKGLGLSAIGIGAVIEADFGDAPDTYGRAGALIQGAWTGGEVPITTTGVAVSDPAFSLATLGSASFRLGNLVDSEGASQPNATATGDDVNGVDDEDGFTLNNPTQKVLAGSQVSATVACTATSGFVAAWYDWNANGVFDAGEKSNEASCTGGNVTLSWTVPADVAATGSTFVRVRLSNLAGITPTGMYTDGEVEDYMVQRLRYQPAISINKVANRSTLVVGDRVTYSFIITNTGDYDLARVQFSDAKLGITNSSCGALAAGASVTCTTTGSYVVTQADVDAGTISNTATAAGFDAANTQLATASDTEVVNGTRSPSIDLTKVAALVDADGDRKADVGERVNYTFTVRNTGNTSLTNVTVSDPKLGINAAACVATLAPGATATCTATGTYVTTQADVDAGKVANTATASATSPTGTVTDTGAADVPSDFVTGLSMTKTGTLVDRDGDTLADAGETINYSFTVRNTGSVTISNVTVTDAKLGINAAPCVATLAPGATATCTATAAYTVTQADVDSGSVANTAGVTGSDPAGTAISAGASATKATDTTAAITMTKTASLVDRDADGRADVGETINYTFTVTNRGGVTVSGITVTDAKLGINAAPCVATLAPGATATCTATGTYVVAQTDVDSGAVANTASALGKSPSGGAVSASAAATVGTDISSGLSLTKTASLVDRDGDARADAGETINYTFTVRNSGNVTLSNVTVTDGKLGISAAPCVATLAPGASATCTTTASYTVTQTDIDTGAVANSATAAGRTPSGGSATAGATANVPTDRTNGIDLIKTATLNDTDGDGVADLGETIRYTFSVRNLGSTTLSNVTVSDPLLGLTNAACVATLAPGASATCTATGTHTVTQTEINAGTVANSASTAARDPFGAAVTDSANANVATDRTSGITLAKTATLNDADGDGLADVGETISYAFSVTNTGGTTLSNVTVTDPLLALTNAACVASLAPGASATCTATGTHTVTQADVDTGGVSNAATASGRDPFGNPAAASANADVTADTASALSVTKTATLNETDGNGLADVGETITYSFSVTNTGKTTLSNVTVTDPLIGLTDAACVATLAPGATATCQASGTYTVTQADLDRGSIANAASVVGDNPRGEDITGGASTTTQTDPASGLLLVKTATLSDADQDGLADVGETINYTFSVRNTGTVTLSNVTVSDPLTGTANAPCVASLAPGATATCTTSASYAVTQADVDSGAITNVAVANATNPQGQVVENPSTTTTPTDPSAGVALVKTGTLNDTDGDNRADVGETISYTFAVTNTATTTLSNVTVSDPRTGLTDAVCVATLAPGATATCQASATYTVTQADVDAGSVPNTATASGTNPFGRTVTGAGTASTAADTTSGLSMTKVASLVDGDGDGLADVGESVNYTFTVTNTGNTTLANVIVSDARAGLTNAPCVATLAPGASATCTTTGSYAVAQADVDSGSVPNTATASGTDPAGAAASAAASAIVQSDVTSALAMTKAASLADADSDGRADVGEVVNYSFTVTNSGNVTLTNVLIDDPRPGLAAAACVDSLAPGASATCTATGSYTVMQADVDSGSVPNTATARGTDPAGATVSGTASAVVQTDVSSGLTMTKSASLVDGDGDGVADVGETMNYTFTVTNSGNVTLSNVTVTDAKLGLAAAACVATLAPGATATCSTTGSYTVTQADVDSGSVANSASTSGSDPRGAAVSANAAAAIPVDGANGLSMTKSATLNDADGDGQADLGEGVSYSFTVTNTGRVTLSNVTLTDAKLGLDNAACVATLAPGATATCTATGSYTVTQPDVDSGSVANSASTSSTDPRGATVTAAAAASVPTDRSASMTLVKAATLNDADGDARADVGETIGYSFVVTNTGRTTLSNLTVTDPKTGLAGATCVATLAPGASAPCAATATYTVTQADVDAGAVPNTASASGTDPFGAAVSAQSSATVPADTTASMTMTKTATLNDSDGNALADLGETITYSFTVTNTGRTTLSNIVINDAKAGLNGAVCVGSLAPGASADCQSTANYSVTQADVDAGSIANSATTTGTDPSGAAVSAGAATTTQANSASGLLLTKTATLNDADGDGLADVGETITYTFSVRNTGEVTISNITVSDAKVGLSNGTCVATLAPGASANCTAAATYTVTQADADAGTVTNDALATGANPAGEPVANPSTTVTPTDPTPGLGLSKSGTLADADGDGRADVGETITYTFTATNTGSVTLSNVTVTDPKLGVSNAACVATLAPGASATCSTTATYTVTQADVDSGSVLNNASAAATDPFGNSVSGPVGGAASAATPTDAASAMRLRKTATLNDLDGDGRADVGETIGYVFTVTNSGTVTLSNVTISDPKLGITDAACVASLAPGASADCQTTGTYTVTQADADAGSVLNAASAAASDPAGNVLSASATPANTTADTTTGLTMVKLAALADADGDGLADVGEIVGYTFTVTNTGSTTLSNVTIADPKLGLLGAACVDTLAPGTSATCATTATYTVTQADVDSGSVANTATTSGVDPFGNSVSGNASAQVASDLTSGLSLSKTAILADADGDGLADVGETVAYTFAVTNGGNVTLSNVTVSDPMLGLANAPCVATLAPGQSATCESTGTYTVTQADVDAGLIANTASASGTDPNGAAVTAGASAEVQTDRASLITMTKTATLNDADGDALADTGETIDYSFTVTNAGKSTLTGVTVTDAKLGVTNAPCVATLAPGATATCTTTATYTITQADVDAGTVANAATATGTDPTGTPVSGGSSSLTQADPGTNLLLVKNAVLNDVDRDGVADAGESITYTFSAQNLGSVTLSNVTVTDPMLALTDAACVATLAPGVTATCAATATYTVTQADVDAGPVANAATASASDPTGAIVPGSSSTVTPSDPTASMTMTKAGVLNDVDGDGKADLGESISYTFTVTNTGSTTLSNVTVTDAKVGLTTAECVATLAPGASATCTASAVYAVTQADVDSGSVANSATTSATDPFGNPIPAAASSVTPTDTAAALSMTKAAALTDADGDGEADLGESISYTFTVTNTGSTTLSNVTVSDAKAGLTNAVCVATLAPGATAPCTTTATYTVTQADVDSGAITNSASASGTDPSGATRSATASAIIASDTTGGLELVKRPTLNDVDGDGLADVGESISYAFTVTNAGVTTLSNVTVSDPMLGLTAASCVETLAPAQSATCQASGTYTVTQADVDAGTVTNTATASGADPAGVPVTGGSTTSTATDRTGGLALVKTPSLNDADGDGLADVGESIGYSFTVTNTGGTTLSNVTVSDAMAGLSNGACVASLAPGASATCEATGTYTVTQADVDAGTVLNQAVAAGTDPFGNSVSGNTTASVDTDTTASLQLVKAASLVDADGDGLADTNDTVNYSFTVTNTGRTTLTNVTIDDEKLGLIDAACVATLAPGASATCTTTASYTVLQSDVDSGAVVNVASASGLDPRGVETSGGSSTSTPADPGTGLLLVKTATLNDADTDGLADVGERIDYSFRVTNLGSVTLSAITITDPILGIANAACVDSLIPGATVICTTTGQWTATQSNVDAGSITNAATASGVDPTGKAVDGASNALVPTDPTAGLQFAKAATLNDADNDGLADVGESVTYGFTVTNTGRTTLSNVTVTDAKLGLTAAPCVDSLAPGATATCLTSATYTVTQADVDAGRIVNTATAAGTDPFGASVGGQSSATVATDTAAAMTMTKTARLNDADGDGLADAGETIGYTFTVTNTGRTTLSNVTVSDPKLSVTNAACVGTLAPGATATCTTTATYTVTQADVDAGTIANAASTAGTDPAGNPVTAGSSALVQADPGTDLLLTKTPALQDRDGDGLADVGEIIDYTFVVTNRGSVTLTNVTLTDARVGLTNAPCADSLAPGASATCASTGTYLVTQTDVDAGQVTNSALATGTNPSGAAVSGSSSTATPTEPASGLSMTKTASIADTDGDGLADVGESINYSFTVTNTGAVTLNNITVTDAKVGLSAAPCISSLAPGASATCTSTGSYLVTQADGDAGSVANTASAAGTDPFGNALAASASTAVQTDQASGLSMLKTATLNDTDGDGRGDLGESIDYSFTVTNNGSVTLTNVTIDDGMLGLGGAPCVASLAPGATTTCQATGSHVVNQTDVDAGSITNSAYATGLDPAGNPVSAFWSAVVLTDQNSDLSLVKTATLNDTDGDGLADAGEIVDYRFTVTNNGDVTLSNLTIEDIRLNITDAPCVASLAPGASATCAATGSYTVTQVDVDDGGITNTATASGADPAGNVVSDNASTANATDTRSGLSVVKNATLNDADGDGLADLGESIDYSFTVTNTGNVTLSLVTVSDSKLGLVNAACVDTLAPGASATCATTAQYVVAQSDVDGRSVDNFAAASAADPFGNTVVGQGETHTPTDTTVGMTMTKTANLVDDDGDGLADVGETINYSFAVTNTGSSTLTNVTVSDPKLGLDAQVCLDRLAPGVSAPCLSTGSYVVTQADVDAGTVANAATATGNDPNGNPVPAGSSTTTQTDPGTGLLLEKTATLVDTNSNGVARAGESIDYTFTVTNLGAVTLTNVTVTDAKIGLNGALCVASLAPGETATCAAAASYVVTQADVDAGNVANAATASGADPLGAPVGGSASTVTPTNPTSGITMVKSAQLADANGNGLADTGETIAYSFVVTNSGALSLSNVTVSDVMLGLDSAACVASLAPGASATCQAAATYTVTQADVDSGRVVNSATTDATDARGNPVTGAASTNTPTNRASSMQVVKSAALADANGNGVADAGETIGYTFVVTNTGQGTLSGVSITDSMLGLSNATCVASLAPGASATCDATATYTVTQADVDAGVVANAASASATDSTGTPVTAGSSTTTPTNPGEGLQLVKTATLNDTSGDGLADAGETITYSFTVTNTGAVTLSNVTLSDPMLGLGGAACVATLAPGASATCEASGSYLVTQADVDSGVVANSATASGADPDGVAVTGTSATSTPTDPAASLSLVKQATLVDADGDGRADAGETITYSFLVTNTGGRTLSAITVSDPKLGLDAAACIGALAPGATATCTASGNYTVTQADVDAGQASNTATAAALDPAGNSIAGEASTSTPTDPGSGLTITKTASVDDANGNGVADLGEAINYSFAVTNTGSVTLSNITFTDAKLGLSGAACVASIEPGGTATCTTTGSYVVTQADVDAGQVANTVIASGTNPSGTNVAGGGSAVTPSMVNPGITVTKIGTPTDENGDGITEVGETISYEFIVTNTGNVTLTDITVSDPKVGLRSAPCVVNLAPGQSATCETRAAYTVDSQDVAAGAVQNTATVLGLTPLGRPVSGRGGATNATGQPPVTFTLPDLTGTGIAGQPVMVAGQLPDGVSGSTVRFPSEDQPAGAIVSADGKTLTVPGEGVWSIDADGNFTFTPEPGFLGDPSTVRYTALDPDGLPITPATVSVTVTAPPTSEPPTSEPPTSEPPTSEPPTSAPPTTEPSASTTPAPTTQVASPQPSTSPALVVPPKKPLAFTGSPLSEMGVWAFALLFLGALGTMAVRRRGTQR